jgi:hypothetical protein
MRSALDPVGHWVRRTKPTRLLYTWRPYRQCPFVLVLHLHQHQYSRILHLQYLAKSQSTQRCQSLITPGSDHPSVLEPHMALTRHRSAHVHYASGPPGQCHVACVHAPAHRMPLALVRYTSAPPCCPCRACPSTDSRDNTLLSAQHPIRGELSELQGTKFLLLPTMASGW